jgi:hypothetical protein
VTEHGLVFESARAATRFYLDEHRRRDKRSISPNGNPSVPRILAEIAKHEETYALIAKCWIETMACDRPGRHLTSQYRLALEVAHVRGEAWLADYSKRVLGVDMTLKQVGRLLARADSILRIRYRSRGLLNEGEG